MQNFTHYSFVLIVNCFDLQHFMFLMVKVSSIQHPCVCFLFFQLFHKFASVQLIVHILFFIALLSDMSYFSPIYMYMIVTLIVSSNMY
jgi:hypothetical protein